jgi:hypothetical protein
MSSLVDNLDIQIPEGMTGIIEHAETAAKAEAREYLGRHLQELTVDQVAACFPGTEITAEMLAGFRMAAELVRDQDFDY